MAKAENTENQQDCAETDLTQRASSCGGEGTSFEKSAGPALIEPANVRTWNYRDSGGLRHFIRLRPAQGLPKVWSGDGVTGGTIE
ncbi:hypothetical protein [Methylobacterium aerolatum]|uniref:Uncharacterized protein n=1 Tax=Methylobacterium aerolatum TaxID=418708 RepID=A0ABU0I7A0_9HYPH|nr:hypothetical protein [Methylobacterium aerolatum]MDQ0449967.1 hypothetical protein [Methylobacterium aerolatum]